ncbi:MAG: pentapeptide repeat-containing protein [Candidatus Thiodiazotropha lotti]|nr:pentapeptide repeat-containing protein [Candidatus Thiodiazotropha lotti]
MDNETLEKILEKHKKWLESKTDSISDQTVRAILRGENLRGADLQGANLRHADLSGANLSDADLRGADLRGAILEEAKLTGAVLAAAHLNEAHLNEAHLIEVDLSGADLRGANLRGASCHWSSFSKADLSGADLSGTDLPETNFTQANLSNANLQGAYLGYVSFIGANLNGADLRDADLKNMSLTSRHVMNDFAYPISEEQLSGIVFQDEIIQAKERRAKQGKEQKGEYSRLIVRLDAPGITPFNFSMLLLSIEATYNNIFYLLNTEETSLEGIERHFQPYYQGMEAENQLQIAAIREGSIEAIFEGLGKAGAELISAVGNIGTNLLKEIREFREQNHRHKHENLDKDLERKKTEAETEGIYLKNEKQRLDNELATLDITSEIGETAKSLVSLTPSEAAVASIVAEKVMPGLGDILNNSNNPVVVAHSPELQKHCIDPIARTFTKLTQYDYSIDVQYVDSKDDTNTDAD